MARARAARRLTLLLFVLHLNTVFSWGSYYHLVLTGLAAQDLSPNAAKALDTILKDPAWKQAYPTMTNLVTSSVWADAIRSKKHDDRQVQASLSALVPKNGNWHYTGVPLTLDDATAPVTEFENLNEEELYKRLARPGNPYDNCENAAFILEFAIAEWEKTSSMWELNVALRYFIHVFADIHQPLHAAEAKSFCFPSLFSAHGARPP